MRRVPSAVLGLSGALLLSLLFAAAVLPVPGADAAGEESGSLSTRRMRPWCRPAATSS